MSAFVLFTTACGNENNDPQTNIDDSNEIENESVENNEEMNPGNENNSIDDINEDEVADTGNSENNDESNDQKIVIENEAFKIFSPAPHDEVENTIVVRGLARVFEATVSYELEDGHYVFEQGWVMASGGGPDWGEFEITLNVSNIPSEYVTLFIYEESAKDGSPQHQIAIPLKIIQKDKDNKEVVIENGAFKILSPAPNSVVKDQVVVKGMARVFEAVFQYELEDGHNILDSGVAMADHGAPVWGNFEITIDFDKNEVANDTLLLILYVASPKDGARTNEIIIPLKVDK